MPTNSDVNYCYGIYILERVRALANEDKPISKSALTQAIKDRYGVNIARSTVIRTIQALEKHYPVIKSNPKNGYVYLDGDTYLDDIELWLLGSALLSSNFIPGDNVLELLDKSGHILGREGNPLLRMKELAASTSLNRDKGTYANIEALMEAIASEHKITFDYYDYSSSSGDIRKMIMNNASPVSPLFPILGEGNLYLLGIEDGKDFISAYRIDLMSSIEQTKEKASSIGELSEYKDGFDLKEYIDNKRFYGGRYVIEGEFIVHQGDVESRIYETFAHKAIITREKGAAIARITSDIVRLLRFASEYRRFLTPLGPRNLLIEIQMMSRKETERIKRSFMIKSFNLLSPDELVAAYGENLSLKGDIALSKIGLQQTKAFFGRFVSSISPYGRQIRIRVKDGVIAPLDSFSSNAMIMMLCLLAGYFELARELEDSKEFSKWIEAHMRQMYFKKEAKGRNIPFAFENIKTVDKVKALKRNIDTLLAHVAQQYNGIRFLTYKAFSLLTDKIFEVVE